jgi:uncharacterized phage-like protein YoqJ
LVAEILVKDIKARDDDNILLIKVWKRQRMKESMTFKQFKYNLIMGKLGLAETIMRSRRLIQEKYPSLRGKMYAERHSAEELLKNQMKLF